MYIIGPCQAAVSWRLSRYMDNKLMRCCWRVQGKMDSAGCPVNPETCYHRWSICSSAHWHHSRSVDPAERWNENDCVLGNYVSFISLFSAIIPSFASLPRSYLNVYHWIFMVRFSSCMIEIPPFLMPFYSQTFLNRLDAIRSTIKPFKALYAPSPASTSVQVLRAMPRPIYHP